MWFHAGFGHNSPVVRWDRFRMCKPGAATGSQQGKEAVVRADAKQVGGLESMEAMAHRSEISGRWSPVV